MMMNLFTVFDPCTGMMSLNWFMIMILFFVFPFGFWCCGGSLMIYLVNSLSFFFYEVCNLTSYFNSVLIMLSFFLYVMIVNLFGLIPYVYTSSSHLVYSLGLSLPLWFSFMFFGWLNNSNHMFMHLVPMGTPYMLMPFMVLIETVSNLIRPFSLAVRLSANMIAGHLLMSLLGGSTFFNLFFISFFFIVYLMISLFELAVSFIQSYVFMTLGVLYSSEV